MDILSKNGKLVVVAAPGVEVELQMKGESYFGLETTGRVPHGLWARKLSDIFDTIKKLKYNGIRLPFSAELGLDSTLMPDPATINYTLNPELVGKSSLEILDMCFDMAKSRGLLVMLDMHVLTVKDGLQGHWFNATVSESDMIKSWIFMVNRYAKYWNFTLVDIFNEPHGNVTWGDGNLATDWRLAAQRIGNAILNACPRLLISVQGTDIPSKDLPVGAFWGGNLNPVTKYPIVLNVANKLVLVSHAYGPDVANQTYFSDPNFPANMPAIWDNHFGFVVKNKLGPALILGEWGGKGAVGSKDRIWQEAFINYMMENGMTNNFHWCVNQNSGGVFFLFIAEYLDTGGLFLDDKWTQLDQYKLSLTNIINPVPTQFTDNGDGTVTMDTGTQTYILNFTVPVPPPTPTPLSLDTVKTKFLQLYAKLHDPKNGYYSSTGIPYHSVEPLIIEAPDYGHLSTSEAASYMVCLEAVNGAITGDYSGLSKAWNILETYFIPNQSQQPNMGDYNPNSPATYAPEYEMISQYPSLLDSSVPVGRDPISAELKSKYGNPYYGMHWLLDVDNWYGFGQGTNPTFINTFQRGPHESVWETIPQPSIDNFSSGGNNGFLDLFTKDPTGNYSKQAKYTTAPDADSRAIQAIFWAKSMADKVGGSSIVDALVVKASKLGDFVRSTFFDKYFKPIGCQNKSAAGTGYDSAHYLQSWYSAFGCPLTPNNWAFKIGSSHCHFGYQNPMSAWVLSTQQPFTQNMTVSGPKDYAASLQRQIQLYYWLQSAEGGIAGGVTNSYNGRYETYPVGTSTFYSMAYQEAPVYLEPPSNNWYGMQVWSMERVANYYYQTRDDTVLPLLTKWCGWAVSTTTWSPQVLIPSNLLWSGQPDSSFSGQTPLPGPNTRLHVSVTATGQDVGLIACLARIFTFFGKATNNQNLLDKAATLISALLLFEDSIGYSTPEARADYVSNLNGPVFVPQGWVGRMPNGDVIDSNATFLSIRSKYKQDPMYNTTQSFVTSGASPVYNYHRYWGQCEIAETLAMYFIIVGNATLPPVTNPPPVVPPTPVSGTFSFSITPGTNRWSENGHAITTYQVVATNVGSTPINSYTFKISCDYISGVAWPPFTPLGNGQYTLAVPSYSLPIQPGKSFSFGFNGTLPVVQ